MQRRLVAREDERFTVGGQDYRVQAQLTYTTMYYVRVSLWRERRWRSFTLRSNRVDVLERNAKTKTAALRVMMGLLEHFIELAEDREDAAGLELGIEIG